MKKQIKNKISLGDAKTYEPSTGYTFNPWISRRNTSLRNGDKNGEDGDENGVKKIQVLHAVSF